MALNSTPSMIDSKSTREWQPVSGGDEKEAQMPKQYQANVFKVETKSEQEPKASSEHIKSTIPTDLPDLPPPLSYTNPPPPNFYDVVVSQEGMISLDYRGHWYQERWERCWKESLDTLKLPDNDWEVAHFACNHNPDAKSNTNG